MNTKTMSRWLIQTVAVLAMAGMVLPAYASDERELDIPAGDLALALRSLAKQTGLEVIFQPDDLRGIKTRGVKGRLSPQEAVAQMIDGTKLVITRDPAGVLLVAPAAKSTNVSRTARDGIGMELAQAGASSIASREGGQSADGKNSSSFRADSQDGDRSRIQEITVTATKREERMQDVPISMAVIAPQDIERRGLIGMQDYLRAIPGVNVVDVGASDNAIVVRGITTSPAAENASSGPTVATYFGETSITGGGGNLVGGIDVRPVDLERIELLRGPQGTTFGSASLSGALRLIPKAPELDRFGAKFAAGYSQTSGHGSDNNMIQGVVNFPIVEERFGVRIVGYRYDESGIYRNVAGLDPATLAIANRWGVTNLVDGYVQDNIGSQLSTGGRIAALWRATGSLRIALNVLSQRIEQKGRNFASLGPYDQASLPVAPIRRADGYPGEYSKSNIDLYNIVMDYDLSWAALTTTASRVNSGVSPFITTTGSPFPYTGATYQEVRSSTAEARLASRLEGRLQFAGGLFYEHVDSPNVLYGEFLGTGIAPNPLPSLGLTATDPLNISQTTRKLTQRALFGELSYALTDQLTATLGGRYFDYDKQEYRLSEGGLVRVPYGTGVPTDIRSSEEGHTLKASVSYKTAADGLLYASWSQGFRLGRPAVGVAPGLCDRDNDGLIDGRNVTIESTRTIDSDFLDSFEIGAKFALFDRRLAIDAAAYHQKWNGLPILVFLPNAGGCNGSYTANAGAARSDGAEIEASFAVIEGLKLTAGIGYTRAELTEDAPTLSASKGARLPGAPRVNANLGAQYDFRIAGHKSFVRADSFYADEFYGDLLQTPGLRAGGYAKVDARAGMSFGPLSAELFVKNLTDRNDFTWRGIAGGTNPFFGYRLRPRTIGLQLEYAF